MTTLKYLFSLASFISGCIQAQTTINGSMMHGGINRSYSFYVPASYTPGNPVPLVLNLHGTGTDGAYQAQNRDFRPIADTANFIVAHPDGSIEPGTSQRFWNYGNVLGSTVDDVGFLEAMIDSISAHYSINSKQVYSAGMSNGGFMSYYLACQSNRFAAIGSVTGSMGTTMYNTCNPLRPTPSIHIHGTSDPVNPYAGNSTSKSIPDVTRFWVNQNSCDTIPVITAVPNINTTDNATAERFVYGNGIHGHTVEHFKVTGGGHTWPGTSIFTLLGNTCMDFSASKELWRFFRQYRINTTMVVKENITDGLTLWPNPVHETLFLKSGHQPVTGIVIIDLQGQVVEKQSGQDLRSIDLSKLKPGMYLAKISGNYIHVVKKIIVY